MNQAQQLFSAHIETALREAGARDIEFIPGEIYQFWNFKFATEDKFFDLRLRTTNWGILDLPAIFFSADNSDVWGWPHISHDGLVCITDHEGVDYDPDDISGVVEWVLNRSISLLQDSMRMSPYDRLIAFADELEGYCQYYGMPKVDLDFSLAVDEPPKLYAEVRYQKDLNRSPPSVYRLNNGQPSENGRQLESVGVIQVSIDQFPGPITPKISLAWFDSFVAGLPPAQQAIVENKKHRGVVIKVPNGFGEALLLMFWGSKNTSAQEKAKVYLFQRRYKDYLIQRVGLENSRKRIVIIGCGAVGSRVAELLSVSGCQEMLLIDGDLFMADNLGRHVLGRASLRKYKSEALVEHLHARLPELVLRSVNDKFVVPRDFELIRDFDVVVLATGNAALEKMIIRKAFQDHWPSLIVTTFVEPGGLGGHAISIRPGTQGCLECLYIDSDTNRYTNWLQTSLIEQGQSVTQELHGCGAFTPYSAIDAARTAAIASERALSEHVGYSRWVGEGVQAHSKGIVPSTSYAALTENRIPGFLSSESYFKENCPCCTF